MDTIELFRPFGLDPCINQGRKTLLQEKEITIMRNKEDCDSKSKQLFVTSFSDAQVASLCWLCVCTSMMQVYKPTTVKDEKLKMPQQ